MENPLIELTDLRKTYVVGFRRRKHEALRGITISIERGEIFGIVGPNGAGKTTTIKILVGLMKQSSGDAKMFGLPIQNIESRRRLGYLPESPYFYEHLKVTELLHYYGQLHGLSSRELKRCIPELVERVGLTHATDRPLKKFSKGMRQRAGLAQALINDPELVVLDEPQSGLDPLGRREVRDLIFDLKQQGKTVVFSSHVLPDVEAVCDRVALFHQGKIVESGSLDELIRKRTHGYEVVISGLESEEITSLPALRSLERRGEVFEAHFELDYDLAAVVSRVVLRGGKVLAVRPLREDLEHIFIRDTGDTSKQTEE